MLAGTQSKHMLKEMRFGASEELVRATHVRIRPRALLQVLRFRCYDWTLLIFGRGGWGDGGGGGLLSFSCQQLSLQLRSFDDGLEPRFSAGFAVWVLG